MTSTHPAAQEPAAHRSADQRLGNRAPAAQHPAAQPPATMPRRSRVLIGTLLAIMTTGALTAFSIFVRPLAASRGWAAPDIMLAFGLASLVVPFIMIASGTLLRRGYAAQMMAVGGICFGLGHILAGLAPTLPLFVLSYGLVTGGGQGLFYSAALTNTMRFFPDRRGMVAGLITAGMGIGPMIIAPAGQHLIAGYGVHSALVILGIAFTVINAAAVIFLVRPFREEYGAYLPRPAGTAAAAGPRASLSPLQMLATPTFWLILAIFVTAAFGGIMVNANMAPLATSIGFDAAAAALTVSLFAVANAAGRLAWGWLSDRIGIPLCLVAVLGCAAGGLALLALSEHGATVLFLTGAILVALAFGGTMSLFAPLTMQSFGPRHNGTNYGLMFLGFSLAAVVAPRWAAASAGAHGGSFTPALWGACVLAAVGLFLAGLFRWWKARSPQR
ncbi:MAG: OFA family MFS transporter [Schaalia turicensis]